MKETNEEQASNGVESEHVTNGHLPTKPETPLSNKTPKMNGSAAKSKNQLSNEPVKKSKSNNSKTLSPGNTLNGKSKTNNSPSSTMSRKSAGSANNSTSASVSSLMTSSIDSIQSEAAKPQGLVVAMHRKMVRLSLLQFLRNMAIYLGVIIKGF